MKIEHREYENGNLDVMFNTLNDRWYIRNLSRQDAIELGQYLLNTVIPKAPSAVEEIYDIKMTQPQLDMMQKKIEHQAKEIADLRERIDQQEIGLDRQVSGLKQLVYRLEKQLGAEKSFNDVRMKRTEERLLLLEIRL